jgi:F0F1-type ATP synthase delta subunit
MLNRFITAIIVEVTKLLTKHSDFFDGNREKVLENAKIPSTIKAYLKEVSEKQFIQDLAMAIEYTKAPQKVSVDENGLLKGIAEFFTKTFINDIYKLPIVFYKENTEAQKEAVNKLITKDSLLGKTLRELLVDNSYQELFEGLTSFIQATLKAPYIVVQTPIELDAEKKMEIKNKLREEYDHCFPIFQINKNLIGGMRIFVDSKVQDFSWLGRINYITSLKY